MQAKKAVAFTEDIDPQRGYIHCVCNWSPNIAWGGTGKLYLILDFGVHLFWHTENSV